MGIARQSLDVQEARRRSMPLDAAPASFGMETLLVPSFDPRTGAYARHVQSASAAPYVLLVAPAEGAQPRNR